MQIETLNKRAQERYNSFVTALNLATEQINEVGKLIERMRKTKTVPGRGGSPPRNSCAS